MKYVVRNHFTDAFRVDIFQPSGLTTFPHYVNINLNYFYINVIAICVSLLMTWNEQQRSEAAVILSLCVCVYVHACVCVGGCMIKASLPHHVLIQPRPDRAT